MTEQPNALKGIKLRVHSINKIEQVPNKPKQPKSECKCIDCNLPELESDYKPEQSLKQPSPLEIVDSFASSGTGQPNTELLIVKTIQGLMSAVSRELDKLHITFNKSGPEYVKYSKKHKAIRAAVEDITLTEQTTLFELQKAFE